MNVCSLLLNFLWLYFGYLHHLCLLESSDLPLSVNVWNIKEHLVPRKQSHALPIAAVTWHFVQPLTSLLHSFPPDWLLNKEVTPNDESDQIWSSVFCSVLNAICKPHLTACCSSSHIRWFPVHPPPGGSLLRSWHTLLLIPHLQGRKPTWQRHEHSRSQSCVL